MIDSYGRLPFEDLDSDTTLIAQQIQLGGASVEKSFRENLQKPVPPRIELTDALVHIAECGPREQWINDAVYRGLALRLRPSGGKSYYYCFGGVTEDDDRTGRQFIGSASDYTIDQARTKAHRLAKGVYLDRRPPRQLPRTMRVNEVLLEYFGTGGSEWSKIVQSLFNRYVVPRHGNDQLSRISKDRWLTIIDAAGLDQRSRGNNLHKGLRAFLNWAVDQNLLPTNPLSRTKLRLPDFPDEPANNVELLTVTQLCSIYEAAKSLGHPWSTMIGLVILTGEPMENVRHLRNRDVDWREGIWILERRVAPADGDHISIRIARLPDEAIDLIAPFRDQKDYFFASPRANVPKPINLYAEIVQRLRRKSHVPEEWGAREIRQAVRFQIERQEGPDAVQAWAKRFVTLFETKDDLDVTL
jgi:integrase